MIENPYLDAANDLAEARKTVTWGSGEQPRILQESLDQVERLLRRAAHKHQRESLKEELGANQTPIIQAPKTLYRFWEEIGRIDIHKKLGHIETPEQRFYQIHVDLPGEVNTYVLALANAGAKWIESQPEGHIYRISYAAEQPMPYLTPAPAEAERPAADWTVIQQTCIICNMVHTIHAKKNDLGRWRDPFDADDIQTVFPYLSAGERELLISGICDACFPIEPIAHETEYAGDDGVNPDDLPQDDDDPNALQNELIELAREDLARELS